SQILQQTGGSILDVHGGSVCLMNQQCAENNGLIGSGQLDFEQVASFDPTLHTVQLRHFTDCTLLWPRSLLDT
ncbi:MAG: hypothetical protein K2X75_05740, partial [Burkholderiaceae bacterium]|nr:hypothetical protein [Burkholderiaceae bacterium]